MFWFPDKDINAGDLVVLYTKSGSMSERAQDDKTVHFYYWGKPSPLWSAQNGYVALLVNTESWQVFRD